MDSLYITGLGPPQIALNGQGVEIKRRKAIALLFYLAVEGRSQSREFLSGLFWPEYGQSKAYAYLRRTLWEIKDALGNSWLTASREQVGIASSANVQTDVGQFQALLQAIKFHDHHTPECCHHCTGLLEDAVHLYRGDFLSGFSLGDCPEFDDWLFLQSEIFRRKLQDSIQHLVNNLEGCDRISEAILYAQRWLAIDNLDERPHRKLMVLFAKNEQVNAALRQYALCQSTLKTELDLVPEIETTNLYNQIRGSRSSTLLDAGQGQILLTEDRQTSWLEQILASPVRDGAQTNLPVQATPFIGREQEIREISEVLQKPDCWMLTLTGMGGIGKTRLARQVAQEISTAYLQGVYFVPLAGLKSIDGLVPKIAEILGLPSPPQEGSLVTQLNSYIRDKTLLLIFDNFDDFTSEAGILQELHSEAASVKFLVTSRERLKISGEWVYDVQGLDFPAIGSGKVAEILDYPAVQLFDLAARRTLSHFQVDEGNIQDVVSITQFMDGMPLGLEMAASWVNTLPPSEILNEIRTNLDFLRHEMQDVPIGQRSMRAVMDYSWNRLNQGDQSALARLCVFQGGFSRVAAEKVAGVSLAELKVFVDRSFIRLKDSGGFHIHELMRQYGLEKLGESPEKHKYTRDRHAAYYCAALQQWGEGLKGPDQVQLLPRMRWEIDNIQAAWVWVTQGKQIEQIERGFEGLCYFYLRTLRDQEGLKACQLALDALEEVRAETGPELRSSLLAWRCNFCLNLDNHEIALASIDSALEMMRAYDGSNDLAPLWARLFILKGIVENYLGNRENSIKYYDRAFEIYQQLGDYSGFSYLMLRVLDTSGVTFEKIHLFFSQAIQHKRKAGDLFNTAYLLYMYCMIVAYHLGQPFQASSLMQEACEAFEKLGDPFSKEMSLVSVDPILNTGGRYHELLEVRKKKVAYARERGDRQATGIYLAEVGETLCHIGDYDGAGETFREALYLVKGGVPYQFAYRLSGLGEVLLVQDRIAECFEIFQESSNGMKIGEKWGVGRVLAGLSVATFKMGDREGAWELVRQATQQHHDGHTFYFAHFSLAAYAYLLSQNGDSLAGIAIYAMLANQKFVRNSQWFNDLYRTPVYAAALEANPDQIAAAESKGRGRNLWKVLEQIVHKG